MPNRSLRRFVATFLLTLAPCAFAQKIGVAIDGVDKPLQAAVRDGIAITRYANRDDISATQARVLADDAAKQAQLALRPYGYYNAQAESRLETVDGGWRVRLHVAPGAQTKVAQLDLQVPAPAAQLPPVRKAVRTFHPRVGEAMQDGVYETSKAAIGTALLENGYLDAKATVHRVEVTRAQDRADIHLHYAPGERYKLGAVEFTGSQFAPGFPQRYVPWHNGEWYTQADLLALQQSLTDADYFSIVDVEPHPEKAVERVVPVDVELAPAKRHVYTAGVFVGTDTGAGVRGGVRWRWLNKRGHKLDTQLVVAQRLKSAQAVYTIPQPGPDHRSFNFGAAYRDENTDTSLSRTFSLAADETRDWHGFVRTFGLHLTGGTFTVGATNSQDIDEPGVEHGRSVLAYPEASLTKKVADDPLFVRRGWSINLVARASPGPSTHFVQAQADVKWIHALSRRDRLILRGDAGAMTVGDFSKLPPDLRFFAGGDRSIRGYGYQAIGPRNDYGRVIGGTRLLVASAEVEHYFTRNWGIAAFVDSGDAFDGNAFHAQTGAGLGVRWRSPVGMVRVDVGVPVNNAYYHGAQLHIVIGPDL